MIDNRRSIAKVQTNKLLIGILSGRWDWYYYYYYYHFIFIIL